MNFSELFWKYFIDEGLNFQLLKKVQIHVAGRFTFFNVIQKIFRHTFFIYKGEKLKCENLGKTVGDPT